MAALEAAEENSPEGAPKLKVGAAPALGAGEGLAEGVELPKPLRFGRPRMLVERGERHRSGRSSAPCQ